jgi:xanthine dehydrogenase accessory factor
MGTTNIYRNILESVTGGKTVFLETSFSGQEGSLAEGLRRRITGNEEHGDGLKPVCVEHEGEFTLAEPFTPPERLIILGCGHIAVPLCDFASKTGFCVTMLDDRSSFADPARFPGAKEVLCDGFAEGIRKIGITGSDFVVVITRGHRFDHVCLQEILAKKAFFPAYLGMIGSRKRVRELLNVLESEGLDRERLDRICTPIGLKTGAVSPEEIAVSILAELIAYRRLPEFRRNPVNGSDVDFDVIEFLATDAGKKAIVTVLSTKGSTPRRAGAKMTVDRVGRITGSIGGGCSEGAVIRDAIALIGSGRYLVKRIDMTGSVAEDEGMVCGGIMDVLIEDAVIPEK